MSLGDLLPQGFQPVFDDELEDNLKDDIIIQKIHLRLRQRNGRKTITTIEGLASDLDLKKIVKAMKKKFNCNGVVKEDEKFGTVIQLSGDQRNQIYDFLSENEISSKDNIVIHGY